MRGPGVPKVSTLAVLKSFSEEENPEHKRFKTPPDNSGSGHKRRQKMLLFGDLSPTKNAYFVFSIFKKMLHAVPLIYVIFRVPGNHFAPGSVSKKLSDPFRVGGALLRILLEMRVPLFFFKNPKTFQTPSNS